MISYVKAFKQWLEAHSLADGYVVQLYQWEDTQKAKPVIVIQPNSGSPQVSDLSSEHYLLISLVAGKIQVTQSKSEQGRLCQRF